MLMRPRLMLRRTSAGQKWQYCRVCGNSRAILFNARSGRNVHRAFHVCYAKPMSFIFKRATYILGRAWRQIPILTRMSAFELVDFLQC